MKANRIAVFLAIFAIVSAGTVVQSVAGMQYNERGLDVEVNPSRQIDANRPTDITEPLDNKTNDRSNYAKWKTDFLGKNKVPPRGIYKGSHLSPSQFQLDYEPTWNPRIKTTQKSSEGYFTQDYNQRASTGDYGVTVISDVRTFKSSEIMNGASQYYVKMPIDGNQLTSIPLNLVVNKDNQNLLNANSQIYPAFYMYEGNHQKFRVNGSNSMGMFDLRTRSGETSVANSIITPEDNYDGAVYHKVNSIIKPNQKYTFTFLAITRNKPILKVDEQTSEYASVSPTLLEITDINGEIYFRQGLNKLGSNASAQDGCVASGTFAQVETTVYDNIDFPLRPHFSFVFTRGIGQGNLFGYRLHQKSQIYISKSHQFNGEAENMTYPSIYTPFRYNGLKPAIRPNVEMRIAKENHIELGPMNITVPNKESNATSTIDTLNGFEVDPISINKTMDYVLNGSGPQLDVDPTSDSYSTSTTGYYGWQRLDYNPYKYNYSEYFLASGPRIEYYATDSGNITTEVGGGMKPYNGNGYIQVGYEFPANTTLLCREPKNRNYEKYPTNTYSPRKYTRGIANNEDDYENNYTPLQKVFYERTQKVTTHWFGERWRRQSPTRSLMEADFSGGFPYEMWWNFTDSPERFFYDVHTSVKFPKERWNTLKMPMGVKYMNATKAEDYTFGHRDIIHSEHRDYLMILTEEVTDTQVEDVEEKYFGLSKEKEVTKTITLQTLDGGVLGKTIKNKNIVKDKYWGLNFEGESLNYKKEILPNLRNTIYQRDDDLVAGFTSVSQQFKEEQRSTSDTIISYLTSIPEKIWQLLQNLGNWIMRHVMDFISPIINILQDIWHIGGMYLQTLGYIFSFLFVFLVLFVVAKVMDSGFIKNIRRKVKE